MNLKLLYPTETHSAVDVGIPTIRLVKILSNMAFFHDATMGQRVIACLCGDHDNHEKYASISSLDGLRIARASKQLEFNSDVYIPKGLKNEKGEIVLLQHDLAKDVKPSTIYAKPQVYTDGTTKKNIQLKPQSVKDQTKIIAELPGQKLDNIIDVILAGYISSIDGEELTDDLSLRCLRFVGENVADEMEKYKKLSTAKEKDSDFTNEIGIFSQDFLLGENGRFV